MNKDLRSDDVFGLIRPYVDAHSIGLSTVGKLLNDCGLKVVYGDSLISKALDIISRANSISFIKSWILKNKITRIGYSYRLDPQNGLNNFGKTVYQFKQNKLLVEDGGPIIQIYFAGLPEACRLVKLEYNNQFPVFIGDETNIETLRKLGMPKHKIPPEVIEGSKYDDLRFLFAKEILRKGDFQFEKPDSYLIYPEYGKRNDHLAKRVYFNKKEGRLPLTRVHVGPYLPKCNEAKKLFNDWLKTFAETRFLDIVSIGSSQLSQSDFGQDWKDKPNGGGVPINSEQDLIDIWNVSRPMLVRTYAGTRNIPQLAEIYEKTINAAWHALSFWWFNQIDGRGPYSVLQNLEQHFETLKVIAAHNKPFEPNIPHHFSFRGGDDYTYVLSAYLAIKSAKLLGVKYIVIQTMLNTPKYTWGIQDLAKARALLFLSKELEDNNFKVYLQPRAGLDYFSPDPEKAKIQLASVTALMDDIDPDNNNSPDIIHVVSYCEAIKLATPDYINESIQITRNSLRNYRIQKRSGRIDIREFTSEAQERAKEIIREVKNVVRLLENKVAYLYSPKGLYEIFRKGVMPVPFLWEGREEFKDAIKWQTGLINGGVKVIDDMGKEVFPLQRAKSIFS